MMDDVLLTWCLRPGDLGRLLQLHGIVYAQEMGFDLTFEGYVARTLGHFTALPDSTRERIWMAEVGNQLVGCVAIVRSTEEVAQLRWLLVNPSHRGYGLGRRLLGEAIAFAQAACYQVLFLDTIRELPTAAALYRAAGFELISEVPTRPLWGQQVTEQRYQRNW